MRFKYYLRGAGLGILLATFVLMIAFAVHGRKISNEEVIRRAQALGMIMPENDNHSVGSEVVEETENGNDLDDSSTDNASSENNEAEDNSLETIELTPYQQAVLNLLALDSSEYYVLEIVQGDTARIIGQKLEDGKVVTDAEAFRKYLGHSGLDQNIKTGTYIIPYGESFSKMIEIIDNGPLEPEFLENLPKNNLEN